MKCLILYQPLESQIQACLVAPRLPLEDWYTQSSLRQRPLLLISVSRFSWIVVYVNRIGIVLMCVILVARRRRYKGDESLLVRRIYREAIVYFGIESCKCASLQSETKLSPISFSCTFTRDNIMGYGSWPTKGYPSNVSISIVRDWLAPHIELDFRGLWWASSRPESFCI